MLEGLTPSIEITMFLVKLSEVSIFLEYAGKKTLSQIASSQSSSSNLKVSFSASRNSLPQKNIFGGKSVAWRDKEINHVFKGRRFLPITIRLIEQERP